MRREFTIWGWVAVWLGAAIMGRAAAPDTGEDVLRFVDGSMLHGQLKELDFEHGLIWQAPAATGPIDFQTGRVDAVRFAHSSLLKLTPTCHVHFANGDDLYGNLAALDGEHVELTTWLGAKLTVPRAGVQSVAFLSKNYTILYEGPYDHEGWTTTAINNLQGWRYRDRGFTSETMGLLGRKVGLTGSSTIEFDLTWSGFMGFNLAAYTETPDRLDFNTSSYLAQFTRGRVMLSRLRPTAPPKNLGNSPPIPALEAPGTLHVALQFDKAESEIDLFVNGVLTKQWKDDDGFTVTGGCLILEATTPSEALRVSNMRVSSWEGHHEPEMAAGATNVDMLRFINHDNAGGKIQEIKDGTVTVDLAPGQLKIPMERLAQIDFSSVTNTVAEAPGPATVRAYFPGGGSLSFELEKWSDNVVQGHSAIFGRLAFQPNGIRELQFNLNRPRTEPKESAAIDFESNE